MPKISNLTQTAQTYKISLEGIDGASMARAGSDEIPEPQLHVPAAPDAVATFRVMVRVPATKLSSATTPLHFVVRSEVAPIGDTYDAVFMGPPS